MIEWQEEQLCVNLIQVISWVHDLCGLLSEAKKMQGFPVCPGLE